MQQSCNCPINETAPAADVAERIYKPFGCDLLLDNPKKVVAEICPGDCPKNLGPTHEVAYTIARGYCKKSNMLIDEIAEQVEKLAQLSKILIPIDSYASVDSYQLVKLLDTSRKMFKKCEELAKQLHKSRIDLSKYPNSRNLQRKITAVEKNLIPIYDNIAHRNNNYVTQMSALLNDGIKKLGEINIKQYKELFDAPDDISIAELEPVLDKLTRVTGNFGKLLALVIQYEELFKNTVLNQTVIDKFKEGVYHEKLLNLNQLVETGQRILNYKLATQRRIQTKSGSRRNWWNMLRRRFRFAQMPSFTFVYELKRAQERYDTRMLRRLAKHLQIEHLPKDRDDLMWVIAIHLAEKNN